MSTQTHAVDPRKGGGRRVFGEAEELLIAWRVVKGGEKQHAVADEIRVHRNTVSNIVRRRRNQVEEGLAPLSGPTRPSDQDACPHDTRGVK